MKLVRSGYVHLYYGRLVHAGIRGNAWSRSTVGAENYAYNLYFLDAGVDPSGSLNRYSGFSLRCLQE